MCQSHSKILPERTIFGQRVSSMLACISNMLEALGSVPSTGKKGRQAGGQGGSSSLTSRPSHMGSPVLDTHLNVPDPTVLLLLTYETRIKHHSFLQKYASKQRCPLPSQQASPCCTGLLNVFTNRPQVPQDQGLLCPMRGRHLIHSK